MDNKRAVIEKGLTVREVFQRAVSDLEKKFKPRIIKFKYPAITEIANDSDWHRTRTGDMIYESVGIYNFNGTPQVWMIGCGQAGGGYPADPYSSDIIALPVEINGKSKKVDDCLRREINRSSYFKNTLLIGLADGRIARARDGYKHDLGKKLFDIINPNVERFIAKNMEVDREFIDPSTMNYLVSSSVQYKNSFPAYLSESIGNIMVDAKPFQLKKK